MLRNLTALFLFSLLCQAPVSLAGNALSAEERLKSCNPSIAIDAAKEIVNRPATLKEPLMLFSPAAVLFQHGLKDDGVFWFYAAQLRVRYQLAFEKGDRGQLLSVMLMTTGPQINNYAFQDVSNLERILDRVREWDKKTPNPFREQPRSESIDKQLEQVYAGLRDLKAKLIAEKSDLEAKARKAAPEIERMYAVRDNPHCRAGQVDPANAAQETIKEKVLVSNYVRNSPEVIRDAGEIKNTWVEYGTTKSTDTMPYRYEVGVVSAAGKESHAIVDVSRSGSDVKFTLVCIARLRWVSRDLAKDPCTQ
jgi:hypothetical protein